MDLQFICLYVLNNSTGQLTEWNWSFYYSIMLLWPHNMFPVILPSLWLSFIKAPSSLSFLPPFRKTELTQGEGERITVVCVIVIFRFKHICRQDVSQLSLLRVNRTRGNWKWVSTAVFFWWSQIYFTLEISLCYLLTNGNNEYVIVDSDQENHSQPWI